MLILIQHKGELGAMGYNEIDYRDVCQAILLRTIMVWLHGF